jgi:mannose/cellobiose epimerase-like protein (N-acyl-D-glucosamine 2-epimerase family)
MRFGPKFWLANANRPSVPRFLTSSVDLSAHQGDIPQPTACSLLEAHTVMRRILVENMQPFWVRGVVDPAGGYRLRCDVRGRWSRRAPKRLVTQARTFWFFSRLLAHGATSAAVATTARQGLLVLVERFWDATNGGFYWELDASGRRPTMPDKHAYGQAQALYALSQYALATGCGTALDLARATFQVLEDRFHDSEYGGYREFYASNWATVPAMYPGYLGAPSALKTANTHLHLLEGVSVYHQLTRGERARQRLAELADIIGGAALHPIHATLVDRHERDWSPSVQERHEVASYGHDLQSVHLLSTADRELGFPEGHRLDLYRRLFDHAVRWGEADDDGGFWSSGPPGQPASDRRKVWWVQAEALLGMLELFRLTGEKVFIDAFLRTLAWVQRWQVDWVGGDWHAEVVRHRAYGLKAGPWKDPYHHGRAMIDGLETLDRLIGRP